ncbi:hypothetical protein B296_00021639 [Ensete ventricosum]|uniref:Uncharacterized protein n=1 Tax=Ensete ventricosum TaxID=4639 RepID=A0A426Z2A2_ENSVE|nr:hypothetical protein B296_00021639 [Ensete ventricosum]
MKQVIALWLWFESIDHYEFIQRVSSYKGDDVILGFVREAEACLDRLMDQREQTRGDELPLTSYLIAEKMDLRFFESHRDEAIKGVRSIFDNVCQIIFDDVLVERAAEAANHPDDHHLSTSGLHDIKQPAREGSSQEEGSASSAAVAVSLPEQTRTVLPPRGSTLNPMAMPWSPEINRSPEDLRSMFITFSRGHPISRADIVEFFNESASWQAIRALSRDGDDGEGVAGAAADVRPAGDRLVVDGAESLCATGRAMALVLRASWFSLSSCSHAKEMTALSVIPTQVLLSWQLGQHYATSVKYCDSRVGVIPPAIVDCRLRGVLVSWGRS